MRFLVLFFVTIFIVVVEINSAAAQDDSEPEYDQEKADAERHFSDGEAFFAAEQYIKAAESFAAAYDIAPHSSVLANIALSYDYASRYVEAVEAYRRYLASLPPTAVEEISRKRLGELEKQVGDLKITCSVDDCRIAVNGVDRGPGPQDVVVLPGSHRITASKEGLIDVEKEISVSAGQQTTVEIVFRPSSEMSVAPMDDEFATLEPGEPNLKPLGWISLGVGVAATGAGVVFQILAGQAREVTGKTHLYSVYQEKEKEIQAFQKGAIAGFVVGGAALLCGIVILTVSGNNEKSKVSVIPGPGGVTLQGTF
ncbi:MAG: PEGA domain-containing protein [Deltaproteobacteria bacterium]|nr:PEGA domain-containing protein [Deltaproteobacteria bacterium]